MKKQTIKLLTTGALVTSVSLLTACSGMMGHGDFTQGEYDYTHHQYGKAFPELLHAARAGNPRAQYAVGYMYYHGMGVQRDPGMARYWINKAAKQGNQSAINALNTLSGSGGTMVMPAGQYSPRAHRPAPPAPKKKYTTGHSTHGQEYDKSAQESLSTAPPMSDSAPSEDLYESKSVHQTAETTGRLSSAKPVTKPLPTQAAAKPVSTASSKPQASAASSSQYALQLFGGYSRAEAEKFIKDKQLQAYAEIMKTQNNGKDWYVVLDGKYSSFTHAKNAMTNLPSTLQQLHPWIRPLKAS